MPRRFAAGVSLRRNEEAGVGLLPKTGLRDGGWGTLGAIIRRQGTEAERKNCRDGEGRVLRCEIAAIW